MRSPRLVASILFSLLIGLVPTAVHALNITISWDAWSGGPADSVSLSGAATVNLDADSPVGGPKVYGPFTIARCANCPGRARVSVSDSDIDKLIFTDAQITNTSAANATLRIQVYSGELTISGPAGVYPYAVELSGSFTAPPGQSPISPVGNQLRVTAFACYGSGSEPSCDRIDNPLLDPGETTGLEFSVVGPPYLVGGTANYGPKENQNIYCAGAYGPSEESFCLPSLSMSAELTLRPRHGARLPGSIGVFHVGDRCEPDAFPPLLAGCDKMADLFASLGPKGSKVYDVRMEPSPGSERTIDFRFWAQNSPQAWRTSRGGDHDDDDHGEGNISDTRVRLESNGAGHVKAKGLCPVSGCLASGTQLPVRVFCGQEVSFTTRVTLNSRGDGKADLIFSLPCSDPAVLIMDPSDTNWVAAPVIF